MLNSEEIERIRDVMVKGAMDTFICYGMDFNGVRCDIEEEENTLYPELPFIKITIRGCGSRRESKEEVSEDEKETGYG